MDSTFPYPDLNPAFDDDQQQIPVPARIEVPFDHSSPADDAEELLQPDIALVQAALAHEAEAIEELGRRLECVPRMLQVANNRLAVRLTNDEVADLAQDTIVRIWKKLGTFEGRATLEAWAWQFGVFELRNRVRLVARRRVLSGTSLASQVEEPQAPEPNNLPVNPEELKLALAGLEGNMRTIVELKHQREMTLRAIASELGISENTAKTRYYRALRQLRETLQRKGGSR